MQTYTNGRIWVSGDGIGFASWAGPAGMREQTRPLVVDGMAGAAPPGAGRSRRHLM